MGLLNAQLGESQQMAVERQRMREQAAKDDGLLRQQFTPLPGPTQDQAPLMPRFDPRSMLGGGASLPSVMQAMQLNTAMQPDKPKTVKLSAGEQMFSEDGKPLFGVPEKADKAPEALRTLAMIYGEGSPQYMAAAQQLARKMTTHQPGVSVTYGAPVAGTDASGNPIFFQPSKDGAQPSIIAGVRPPAREMPSGMAEKFAQNAVTLGKIDKALELVAQNPGALGAQNYAPEAVVQRLDPDGVPVRAMIADIGGQKIHDRSGAAVTVGESERLKPYIPAATDTPATAAKKLKLFRAEYAAMQQALASGASIKQAAAAGAPTGSADADKERRYQEWKRSQGAQ